MIFLVHRVYDGLLGFGLNSWKGGFCLRQLLIIRRPDWFLFSNYFILDHIQIVWQPNWYHGQQTIFTFYIKSTSFPLAGNVLHNFKAVNSLQITINWKQAERAAPVPGLVQTRCQPFVCFYFTCPVTKSDVTQKTQFPGMSVLTPFKKAYFSTSLIGFHYISSP